MVEQTERVTIDKVVTIHYLLTSSQGEILDRSGEKPMPYLHGHGAIVPGLERQIEGRTAGDKFRAVVPPAEGYGEKLSDAQREVPRDAFPEEASVAPGSRFSVRGPDGNLITLWVVDTREDQVVIDLNHPLAGETLTFDVEVVAIRDATEQELKHGHAHGPHSVH